MYWSLRNISAWIIAELLIVLGFVSYAKRKAFKGKYILSIYLHNPSKQEFECCITWLKKNKFAFLSIDELDEIINNKKPFPKGAVILTVDDGWASNKTNIVPFVNKYEVPITIFIATSPVEEGVFWWSYWLYNDPYSKKGRFTIERLKGLKNSERVQEVCAKRKEIFLKREALTVDEVINISESNYISIGSHSHTHPILVKCDSVEAYQEIKISKEKLVKWINKEINYFAYPNGDFTTREVEILKSLDFRLAFGTDAVYLTPDRLKENYNIPRFCFVEGVSFAENICRMVGIWKFIRKGKSGI